MGLWTLLVLVLAPCAAWGQANVTVTAPVGGEVWPAGTNQTITWSSDAGDNVLIELSRDGGLNFDEVLFGNTPNDGQQTWNVTGPTTTQARIRVTALGVNGSNTSAADFTIAEPRFQLTSPAGGESWTIGSIHTITWTAGSGNVRVELSRNGGPYSAIFGNIPNDGQVDWTVTGPASTAARIRVTQLSAPGSSATSAAPFSIVSSSTEMTVVAPQGGESWSTGSFQQIVWSGSGDGNVRIELSRDGSQLETLFGNTPNDGQQTWQVSGPPTTTARIRVTRLDDPTAVAESAADFTIRGIKVTAPNGDEVWVIGTQQQITWQDGDSGAVKIELSRDNGLTFETLFGNIPNDGSELWTVEGPIAGECLVRITQLDGPDAADVSDAPFIITDTVGLTITTPTGGETWPIGSRQVIRWTGLRGGRVSIEISRDAGDNWEPLFASTPNDGQQIWIVAGPATVDAMLRITHLSTPLSDVSDSAFTITTEQLTVVQPQVGDHLVIGTERLIQWAGRGEGEVRVELSRDGGASWEVLFEHTDNDGGQFWGVTGPATDQGLVRITALGDEPGFDVSDGPFSIASGTLVLSRPNGGEQWGTNSTQVIQWSTTTGGTVRIELSRDGGGTWETIALNTVNDGSEPWVVTGPPSNSCRVRLSSWQDAALSDTSNASFSVFCAPANASIAPGQTVSGNLELQDCQVPQRPAARSRLYTFFLSEAGLVTIDLKSQAFEPYLVLYGPSGTIISEQGGTSGAARLDSIELPAGGPFTIVVSSVGEGVGPYSVTLSSFDVELLAPIGGETWKFGERRLITWKSGAPNVPATITLLRSGSAGAAEVLFGATANDGLEAWQVTPPPAGLAVLQVCIPYGSLGTTVCDQSLPFTLQPCAAAETRACYDGAPETVGVGPCKTGTQACGSDGIFDACEGAVVPQSEICGDGIDQDCNGIEAACPPCPVDALCDDNDPCTSDQCIAGQCRADRPTVQELIDCRRRVLRSAVGTIAGVCTAQRVPRATRARLRRLVAKLERALTQARNVASVGECVELVARARRKVVKLNAVLERMRLCPAARVILETSVADIGVAIVSASSCVPRP